MIEDFQEENYLQEHNFEETVIHQQEMPLFSDFASERVLQFEAQLKEQLPYIYDEAETIRTIIAVAIDIEGVSGVDPELIADAVLYDPNRRAEFLAFAERLTRNNLS